MSASTTERDPNDDGDRENNTQPQKLEELAEKIVARKSGNTPNADDPMAARFTRIPGQIDVYIGYHFYQGATRMLLVHRCEYLGELSGHERFYFEIDLRNNRNIQIPESGTRADLLALRAQYDLFDD